MGIFLFGFVVVSAILLTIQVTMYNIYRSTRNNKAPAGNGQLRSSGKIQAAAS